MAGAVGIEPTQAVLETAVLPLYDAPSPHMQQILFGFLVFSMLLAPFAKLLHHQAVRRQFFVLARIIINMVANRAFHRNSAILGHIYPFLVYWSPEADLNR